MKTKTDTDRDWPEDFEHENGKYLNKCYLCQNFFLGHKKRIRCKKCTTNLENAKILNELDEEIASRPWDFV